MRGDIAGRCSVGHAEAPIGELDRASGRVAGGGGIDGATLTAGELLGVGKAFVGGCAPWGREVGVCVK